MLGDTLVSVRRTPEGKRAGHVAFYVGEDSEAFHHLGGNPSDRVCVSRMGPVAPLRRPTAGLHVPVVERALIELARAGAHSRVRLDPSTRCQAGSPEQRWSG
jgi:hypothetical protein